MPTLILPLFLLTLSSATFSKKSMISSFVPTRVFAVSQRTFLRTQCSTQVPQATSETRGQEILRARGYKNTDKVVLYDGVCGLCNRGVRALLRLDTDAKFKYAALQSDAGHVLLKRHGAPTDLSTMVYVANGKAYTRSDAVLNIAKDLGSPLALPATLVAATVPRPVRDFVYTRIIARNRYAVFGKSDVCQLVHGGYEGRFLE